MRGKRQNQSSFDRKRAKQANRRRPHTDKYAAQRPLNNRDAGEGRADDRR